MLPYFLWRNFTKLSTPSHSSPQFSFAFSSNNIKFPALAMYLLFLSFLLHIEDSREMCRRRSTPWCTLSGKRVWAASPPHSANSASTSVLTVPCFFHLSPFILSFDFTSTPFQSCVLQNKPFQKLFLIRHLMMVS